jgi:hypothetical protein
MPNRFGRFMQCADWQCAGWPSEPPNPRPCAPQRLYGGGGKPPGGFLADGHTLPSRTAGAAHGLLDSVGLDQHPRAAALAQAVAAGILTRRANDLCKQRTPGQSKRYSAHPQPRDPGATIMLTPHVLQCVSPTASGQSAEQGSKARQGPHGGHRDSKITESHRMNFMPLRAKRCVLFLGGMNLRDLRAEPCFLLVHPIALPTGCAMSGSSSPRWGLVFCR